MKSTINEHQFIDGFTQCGRGDQFTRGALRALFEYFEQYEEDCDTELEYDPIAICCEYTEYVSIREACKAYDYEIETLESDHERNSTAERDALEWLSDRTQVIELSDGGVVVLDF